MSLKLIVNGVDKEYPERLTLRSLAEKEVGQVSHLAIAVNGEVIGRSEWEKVRLADGDAVEMVKPIQGGFNGDG